MVSLALFSCSGEDGVDRTNGTDGVDETDSVNGTDGMDGENGNANVIASDWIDSEFSTTSSNFSFFSVEDSRFSSININSGVVLVYGKIIPTDNSSITTSPMPYQLFNESYSFDIVPTEITDSISTGSLLITPNRIRFTARSIDNTFEVFERFTEFRYVIIPPSSTIGKSAINYKKMSYEDIMNHFELDY